MSKVDINWKVWTLLRFDKTFFIFANKWLTPSIYCEWRQICYFWDGIKDWVGYSDTNSLIKNIFLIKLEANCSPKKKSFNEMLLRVKSLHALLIKYQNFIERISMWVFQVQSFITIKLSHRISSLYKFGKVLRALCFFLNAFAI